MGDKNESCYELWDSSRTDSRLTHTIAKSLGCYSTVDSKNEAKFAVKISDN